jgi:hypothetical protein
MFLRAILGCGPEQVNDARLGKVEKRLLTSGDSDAFEEFQQ